EPQPDFGNWPKNPRAIAVLGSEFRTKLQILFHQNCLSFSRHESSSNAIAPCGGIPHPKSICAAPTVQNFIDVNIQEYSNNIPLVTTISILHEGWTSEPSLFPDVECRRYNYHTDTAPPNHS